ncbi:hypothetical protein [Flavobacterium sp. KBS0721]|uniref:hypothetical protein n=1 Tax=Flavobacterium sp. KBS0721 TaxID=1179672 RepID=UPI00098F3245|nr:hypothetical protein [Flavobacterium sp. KBS0721]QDW23104.1 hypothetical protein B0M43_0024275 [Flavobacterium sp. KBS0721]
MFYIISIVTKALTSKRLSDETCPVCLKKGCLEVTLYSRYAKAIIPFLSMGSPTSVHCTECGHEIKSVNAPYFDKKKYTPGILNGIKDIKASRKHSLFQFINHVTVFIILGLALIYGLFSLWSFKNTNTHINELLKNPKVGDVYKVNMDSTLLTPDGRATQNKSFQTLFKVINIKNDTLLMVSNKHKSEGIGVSENDWNSLSREDNAFETIPHKISLKGITEKKEIFEFFNQKKIDSINKTDEVKSTNPFHFSASIGKVPNYNGIEIVERK